MCSQKAPRAWQLLHLSGPLEGLKVCKGPRGTAVTREHPDSRGTHLGTWGVYVPVLRPGLCHSSLSLSSPGMRRHAGDSINSLHPWAAFQEGPSRGSEQETVILFLPPPPRSSGWIRRGGRDAQPPQTGLTRCLSHRPQTTALTGWTLEEKAVSWKGFQRQRFPETPLRLCSAHLRTAVRNWP